MQKGSVTLRCSPCGCPPCAPVAHAAVLECVCQSGTTARWAPSDESIYVSVSLVRVSSPCGCPAS
eukprot:5954171-Prymnesium_polylepis.1